MVEAALATDSIVLSRDDDVRRLLHRAARRVGRLRAIAWANPVDDDSVLEWLESRRSSPDRFLGRDVES